MITVHHLENSRSQRILWLLEELGTDYTIEHHKRDAVTQLAPESLKLAHPLGRAPVVVDGDAVLAESAAIIAHLLEYYDEKRAFAIPNNASDKQQYRFWMHFAEGSLMPSLVTQMVLNKGKEKVGFPFSFIVNKFVEGVIQAYFGPNLETSLHYVEQHLALNHGFIGEGLTGVDFQMIFPLEALVSAGRAAELPAITAYVKRIHQRDAYQKALHKGGKYAYATLS